MDLDTKESSHRQINNKDMVEGIEGEEFAKGVISKSHSIILEDGHEGAESMRTSSKVLSQEGSKVLEPGNEEVDSKSRTETIDQEKSVIGMSTDNLADVELSNIIAIMEPSASAIGSVILETDNEEILNLEVAMNEEHSVEKQDSDYQDMNVTFSLLINEEEEVVEEESFEEEEATPVVLDREPYYLIFQKSMKDYGTLKRLNQYLQHKLSVYFIKREMTHVLKEGDHYAENLIKYKVKLDQFHDLIKRDREERQKVTKENEELQELRDRLIMESEENYASLQQRERETGTGLIFTKTGKEMSEKMLKQCLSNQHDKAKELQQLRLQHVKIKNASTDLQVSLKALDKIGNKYTLVEFEQLKMKNRTQLDKIEERDDELSKLRKTCNKANQSLAHIREKSSAIEIQIRKFSIRLMDCENSRIKAREEVNQMKQRRDYYRNETHRLKLGSGLLTKDKLLLDMEHTIENIKTLELEEQRKNALYVKLEGKLKNMKSAFEKESKKSKYKRQLSCLPKKRGVRQVLR